MVGSTKAVPRKQVLRFVKALMLARRRCKKTLDLCFYTFVSVRLRSLPAKTTLTPVMSHNFTKSKPPGVNRL